MPRRIWDILAARPTARGPAAVLVQCLLILLWHALFLAVCIGGNDFLGLDSSRFWVAMRVARSVRDPAEYIGLLGTLRDFRVTAQWSAVLLALEAVLAYMLFRLSVPRAPHVAERFVRSYWRTCLWGIVLAPPAVIVWWLLPPNYLMNWTGPLPLLVGMVIGPVVLARREIRPRRRRQRWRPVCPECGYSLRRSTGDRCPECGAQFPTPSRANRRWAVQRLSWDRRRRVGIGMAYLRTVRTIIFRPCRAARALVIPDQRGRAMRWALFHIGLASLVGLMLGSDMYFTNWLIGRFYLPPFSSREIMRLSEPPMMRVAVWALQSYAAWFVAIGFIPLLGAALSVTAPGRRRFVRSSAVKWSLYCSAVPAFVVAAWGTLVLIRLPWSGAAPPVFTLLFGTPATRLAMAVPAVIYALWWSSGLSVNPYLRRRGFAVFLLNSYLFVLIWLALTQWIFAPGPLRSLL